MRLTIVCPNHRRDVANELAVVMGLSLADRLTFGEAGWQDDKGKLYSAASFIPPPGWLERAQSPLGKPQWAEDDDVNLGLAAQAQALVSLWTEFDDDGEPNPSPVPSANKLLAMLHPDGLTALALAGIGRVEDWVEDQD